MQLLSGMASYYHIREMALDDNWHRRDQERNVFLFSEDNNPSSGTFWVGRNDPAPGPVNWRSLPAKGRLRCLPVFISAIGTGWRSGRRSPGNGAAFPLCPAGPSR